MRRVSIVLIIFSSLLVALPAAAADVEIDILFDRVVKGDEDEVKEVAVLAVDPALIGARCTAGSAQTERGSVHPGNDFIISSGGTSAEIPDFEATSGGRAEMVGAITLGTTITVELRLGPDGVSSGGFLITLDCTEPGVGRFVDDDGSIFEEDIEWLAEQGITLGCNPPKNDRFCPKDRVTRGQMAAFLARALKLTDKIPDRFIDDDRSIFEEDIDKLAAAAITSGCNPPTNNMYCPDHDITRGQMAAFLVRAFGYGDNGGGDLFIDDDESIFRDDIDKLGTAGVTLGCNPPVNDMFCPDSFVTREQMAAFLHRALG